MMPFSESETSRPIAQMFHQGFVDFESYRKVVEDTPDIAQMVAEKYHTTLGGVRKLIQVGGVTPQDFIDANSNCKGTS